ncbi:hypothetical protein BCR34DRAFT_590508 [Clohesyomyces aquaticus]|uniref:Uncharacterized protein n=1 Tax=Clohesyomyces aquaticus TaxID=1231657 RepID=A0A1Y1Z920_9PLEO|nr:hypothetical protein BCR34DRAFT_590508 [Clohesyomyces aquaticus]
MDSHSRGESTQARDGRRRSRNYGIVDECCDLWLLRNRPPSNARPEAEMRMKSTTAFGEYQKIRRSCARYFHKTEDPEGTYTGRKLTKRFAKKEEDLKPTQINEAPNAKRQVFQDMTMQKLKSIADNWDVKHPDSGTESAFFTAVGLHDITWSAFFIAPGTIPAIPLEVLVIQRVLPLCKDALDFERLVGVKKRKRLIVRGRAAYVMVAMMLDPSIEQENWDSISGSSRLLQKRMLD